MLLVPMILRTQLVGVLTADRGPDRPAFSSDELALAAGAARLAALVLERERLLREREEARANALAMREANRRMDEFLGIATHELKTPVTSSGLCIELAVDSLNRVMADLAAVRHELARKLEPIQDLMARADSGMERLNRLMNDLLDVSRIRAGQLDFRLARCDLAAVVRDAVAEQRQIAPTRTIALRLAPGRVVAVWADAERIGQVLTNFLTNALKYSPADQPVKVGLRVVGGWARVRVRDRGPGIAPDEQERIWRRFHRCRASRCRAAPAWAWGSACTSRGRRSSGTTGGSGW
jgi:signal transduction histidine kinase